MDHFYENIKGWFTFPLLYSISVDQFPSGSHFVEVGSWLGKSSAFMAVCIANSGKNIKFDCVDTWQGSEEHGLTTDEEKEHLFQQFLTNMQPVRHLINPIRLPSLVAAKLYADESLDFVFIDASHDYENVKADLIAWYPKVKKGGIISGHDYLGEYEWPGVYKAVNEFFSGKNLQCNGNETSWMHYK